MLFQLGPITIDSPAGLNATEMAEEFGSDFAPKPVVGVQQPREFVGEADNRMTLTGTLFPFRAAAAGQPTGLPEIEALRVIAQTGEPQILVRGDGTNMGWWLVERVSPATANIGNRGIGRQISWSIAMVKSPRAASAGSLIGLLTTLLS